MRKLQSKIRVSAMKNNSHFSILNSQSQNRKAILLIEDSKRVQNYNKRMLEDAGFVTEPATTLAAARESLERRVPDTIILDIGMPDGVAKRISSASTEGVIPTKIIAIIANNLNIFIFLSL